MNIGPSEKRSVTPEQTIKSFREKGVEITKKEAENILEIMYFLAKLIVNQNFKK